jgi:uncharacterized RDD family membrane protein YckC
MEISLPVAEPAAPQATAWPTTAKKFGPRAVAYLIDLAAIIGLGWLLGRAGSMVIPPVLAVFGRELFFIKAVESSYGLRLLDSSVSFLLYAVLFESLFGATLGKLILNMRVVQLDGRLCGFGAAVVRGVLRIVDGLVFGAVAAYSMAQNPELQQRHGDRAARTVVVDRRDPFIRDRRAPWRFLVALVAFLCLAEVWGVAFGVIQGAFTIAPKAELVAASAAAANLKAADFSPTLDLSSENVTADFTNFKGKDINERLFVSDAAAVQSRVVLFKDMLIDAAEDLSKANKDTLATEFKGTELTIEDAQPPAVGDLAVLHKFTDQAGEAEGYVLAFRRNNAFVRLIFYGPSGQFTPEQVSTIAGIIDARLTSSGGEAE